MCRWWWQTSIPTSSTQSARVDSLHCPAAPVSPSPLRWRPCTSWLGWREWKLPPIKRCPAAGAAPWMNSPVKPLRCSAASRRAFGRQIAFNVIPQVDAFDADGASREEHRLWEETRRVLDLPGLGINATAVRVPVFFGHSLAVHAAFERPVELGEALNVLQRGTGLSVIDAESVAEFPTPATLATAPDRVYVGRVRVDLTRDRGLNFWVVAQMVRKGEAYNAVSVAQILVNRCQ